MSASPPVARRKRGVSPYKRVQVFVSTEDVGNMQNLQRAFQKKLGNGVSESIIVSVALKTLKDAMASGNAPLAVEGRLAS